MYSMWRKKKTEFVYENTEYAFSDDPIPASNTGQYLVLPE